MLLNPFANKSLPNLGLWALPGVLLLAGCGEGAPAEPTATAPIAAVEAGKVTEPAKSVVVSEAPSTTVAVGSQGGSLRLTENVGAVYSIAYRDDGAWLEGVVLLRGTERGWYMKDVDKAPFALDNPGIGGSLGPHTLVITPKADGVWIDDRLYVPLQGNNVALFDGAGTEPTQVGLASLEPYLGPAPLQDAKQRTALVQERLRAMITNSKAIASLWAAQ